MFDQIISNKGKRVEPKVIIDKTIDIGLKAINKKYKILKNSDSPVSISKADFFSMCFKAVAKKLDKLGS